MFLAGDNIVLIFSKLLSETVKQKDMTLKSLSISTRVSSEVKTVIDSSIID